MRLCFKRIIPGAATRPDVAGLIAAVDAKVGLGPRLAVEGLYSRDTLPSVLSDNLFYVSNRYGAFLLAYLGRNFYVRPGVVRGTNNYPADINR